MRDHLNKSGLQTVYGPRFHGANLHHLIPRTRNGRGNEYNLFPYQIKRHGAYHDIFFNLRIDEVWEMLDEIHYSIFESGEDSVLPWWIEKCHREVGDASQIAKFSKNKRDKLRTPVSVMWLQTKWAKAFGTEDLKASKEFLKLMMLFMVFGAELLEKETLFNNGNLAHFLESTPCTEIRLWAFERCFGPGGSVSSMKKEIVSIVDRFDYYSKEIL